MNDPMEALFIYAQERMVRSLLERDPEFYNVLSCLERQENSFRALLDDDAGERFEKLIDEQSLFSLINERAVFRAGFQLAMELSR